MDVLIALGVAVLITAVISWLVMLRERLYREVDRKQEIALRQARIAALERELRIGVDE